MISFKDFLIEAEETWYHGTNQDFDNFHPNTHFGTEAQAKMRNSKKIIPVKITATKFKTMRDTGRNSWDAKKLARLQRQGYHGVRYLNRYEGIPHASFQSAAEKVGGFDKLDALPDSKFAKHVPEATHSLIIFDPKRHVKRI